MRLLGGTLVFCAAMAGATAAADPIAAGPQAVPPVEAGEPVLPQQLDGRRAVRGCAVDETCARPGEAMKEIDVELFPRPGDSPWVEEHATATSRLEPGPPVQIVKRPSELRPDQPWLDQLELPDIPVRWSQKLIDYLVFYKNDPRGRSIISSWLVAQGRYKDLITSHLRKAKLPQDLLYVSMIESSYDPNTLSSAGALGLWQFMPEGGKIYGLRQDRWVDERKDPLRSTIAQMDYFRDLYQRFGDWHIALAAFNVGYGAMLRSVARYNTNDYYKLCEYENAVPWETCLYTPKVLATAIVGHNRALFGFDKLSVKPAESFDEVAVPASVSLAVIARAAGSSEGEIKRLNPHLRRGRTPPGEAGYVVRVPTGTKADTQRRLAELQSDWDGYDAYVVAHGERFEDVATTYGISTSTLRRLNGVEHESEITGGTVLVVPRISAEQRTKNRAKAKSKLLGSGIDQKDGEALIVPVPDKDFVLEGKQRVFYRVVTGDTVKSIASAFGVTADDIRAWNGLDPQAHLHPKMVVVAWVHPTFDAEKKRINLLDETQLVVVTRGSNEHLDIAEARTGRVRVEYVAKGKEKLADIAKRYGMGSHDLARINRISYNTVLGKGDKVIVYQVTDPSRSERAEEQWRKTPRGRRGKVTGERARTAASADSEDEDDEADDDEKQEAKPKAEKAEKSETSDKTAKTVKPEKAEKPDNAVKREKPEKTEKKASLKADAVRTNRDRDSDGPVTRPTQSD
ncbi:MAG: LysM peptidoglycan-binding domain-containing protein [Kofleriaceae bacterium]|nr:LysM peptidoglycan-binding domain-containing protein [Kofleriaceae bacterium]